MMTLNSFKKWILGLALGLGHLGFAQEEVIVDPLLFCLVIPSTSTSSTFGHMLESFNNHTTSMQASPRGGELALMNRDGSVRLLTQEADFGLPSGEIQTERGIAVREPSVHWSGCRALFSMVVGGPVKRFDLSYRENRWQIYEITNLCDVLDGAVANIVKVEGQPDYNNFSAIYGTDDDNIFFISDKPYGGLEHTYPQRDEYESTPINTGIWKLSRSASAVTHLTHSPSGDFDLFIASDGRLLFTRWSHIQQDQQADGYRLGTKPSWQPEQYESEAENAQVEISPEFVDGKIYADKEGVRLGVFPEPRTEDSPNYVEGKTGLRFNEFQIWEIFENGERNQTINHIGRHELGGAYTGGMFLDDRNLTDYASAGLRYTANKELRNRTGGFAGFFQITEDLRSGQEGHFYFSYGPEFGSYASGLALRSYIPMSMNPEDVVVEEVSGFNDDYPLGRFRDPVVLSDGTILFSHTVDREHFNRSLGINYHFQINKVDPFNFSRNPLTGDGFEKEIVWWGDLEEPHRLTVQLMEVWTVPVISRPVPSTLPSYQVDPLELEVIEEEEVNVDELRAWLIENDLAMLAIRDVTKRDRADVQQPYNLLVPGGVSSIADEGKSYEISHFQPFQFELVRGYPGKVGRRTFPLPFRNTESHPILESVNPYDPEGPESSLKISPDGSVALFVPATRALAWWTKSPEDQEIVVERQPLSFAPGEIMTCPGCHGINRETHDGSLTPTNKPQALRELLSHWKQNYGSNPLNFEVDAWASLSISSIDPNPFNSETVVSYVLAESGDVDLSVYDLMGRKVVTLTHQHQLAGRYTAVWNGTNSHGQPLPNGIYISILTNGSQSVKRRLIHQRD